MISHFFSRFLWRADVERPVPNHYNAKLEVDNWLLSEFVIKKLVPIVGFTPYPLNELMLMSAALVFYQPRLLLEWGTHYGNSARIFFETIKFFNLDCRIHSIELPANSAHMENPHKHYAKHVKSIKDVQLHRGDGLTLAIEIALESSTDNRVLFYLDGDHDYDVVLNEISQVANNFPLAAIIIHDTFYQNEESGYNVGPYRAVRAFLENSSHTYQLIETSTGLPGMSLLIPEAID